MTSAPVAALEIGTTKVMALVGDIREDGHIMITGMGTHTSRGVRKGEIVDLESAVVCARNALTLAEESSGVEIREIHVAVSGGHIQSTVNRGTIPVAGPDNTVTEEDVLQVMEVARALNLPPDREILHTICQLFRLDDQQQVIRPEGMVANRLGLDMLVIHGVRNRLHNTVRAVRTIPVEVADVAFGGLCSALAVLTPDQKRLGAVVVDLGGGTTDYVAYADGVVMAAGTLAVGGDHLTNDIAVAFGIPLAQAEEIKRRSGSAIVSPSVGSRRFNLPGDLGLPGRSISMHTLHTVIQARMEETFTLIRAELENAGLLPRLGRGVVLVGGGAHLDGISLLAERIFGMPAPVGRPRNISGLATATEGPECATVCGLIQYAVKTADAETHARGRLLDGLRRLFRW